MLRATLALPDTAAVNLRRLASVGLASLKACAARLRLGGIAEGSQGMGVGGEMGRDASHRASSVGQRPIGRPTF